MSCWPEQQMGVNIMLLEPLVSVIETLKERIAVHGASLRENETRLAARAEAFSGWLRVRGCWLWIRPERVFLPRAWVRKFDTTASDCHRSPLRMQSRAECNSPEYRVGVGWADYALRSVGNKPAAVIASSTPRRPTGHHPRKTEVPAPSAGHGAPRQSRPRIQDVP